MIKCMIFPSIAFASLVLVGCGESAGTTGNTELTSHTVSATAQGSGSINPSTQTVTQGNSTSFTLTPESGYSIESVAGCDGTLADKTYTTAVIIADCTVTVVFVEDSDSGSSYSVTPSAGANGSISPSTAQDVDQGEMIDFTVIPDSGYVIDMVAGCDGSLSGDTFTTGDITADCTVAVSFREEDETEVSFSVTVVAGPNGSLSPNTTQSVIQGETTSFSVTPDSGYSIANVTGCGGELSGSTFTTSTITEDCTVTSSFESLSATDPGAPELILTPTAIKTFAFSWEDVSRETQYRLLENPDGISGYTQVAIIEADATSHEHEVYLPGRINASYILEACNDSGCTDSNTVFVSGTLAPAVGTIRASNAEGGDLFGISIGLSADANTLAIGASDESSNATGINGDQNNNDASDSGAVYIFTRIEGSWSQQAYLKASITLERGNFGSGVTLSADGNTLAVEARNERHVDTNGDLLAFGSVYVFSRIGSTWTQQERLKIHTGDSDFFGETVALSADGNTLAIGSIWESSAATGIDGDQSNNDARASGAVYVFTRSGTSWSQQAYVKASNTEASDRFGTSIALSGDGNILAVGAKESSDATGINGDQNNNNAGNSGAVYVFSRSGSNWSQQAYVKASNTRRAAGFGDSVGLSVDGNTLAVGSPNESSSGTGIDGDQNSENNTGAGAVYVFSRSGTLWSQQAYIKASNNGELVLLRFGTSVGLSADGDALVVGAPWQSGSATGINGDPNTVGELLSGAAYVFIRRDGIWSEQAYVKSPNTDTQDKFGTSVALTTDGNTLAVGASNDDFQSGTLYLY